MAFYISKHASTTSSLFVCILGILSLFYTSTSYAAHGAHEYEHKPKHGVDHAFLHGGGTSNPSMYIWDIMERLQDRTKSDLRMTYRATGSSTGIKEFVGDNVSNFEPYNNFGAGDVPIPNGDYTTLTSGLGIEVLHIPFALGSVGIFHSVPSSIMKSMSHSSSVSSMGHSMGSTSSTMDHSMGSTSSTMPLLNITHCVLADIFAGTITDWSDPSITALNPMFNLTAMNQIDTTIKVTVRTSGSSSTNVMTSYLELCTAQWGTLGSGTTITWPVGFKKVVGSGGMSSELQSTPFAIGYLDSGHGHLAKLAEVELRNKNGIYLDTRSANLTATAEAASSAFPTSGTADWSSVELFDQAGDTAWPLTSISYFYVRKNMTDVHDHGSLMKAFLQFVMSSEGQGLLEKYHFSKIPAQLVSVNADSINSILVNANATEWRFEDSVHPYDGAGWHVFSKLRKDYVDTELRNFESNVTEILGHHEMMMADHTRFEQNITQVLSHHEMMMADHTKFEQNITEVLNHHEMMMADHTRIEKNITTVLNYHSQILSVSIQKYILISVHPYCSGATGWLVYGYISICTYVCVMSTD